MNTKEAIYRRRSIRKFKSEKISDDIIENILKCAMAAPSACNKQPWEFYVIKSEEKLIEVRQLTRNSNFSAPLAIVVCGNRERTLSTRDNDFYIQDCSAAIENMLLYATSIGIGTLWCGITPVQNYIEKAKKFLNAGENIEPLGLIYFGYPDEEKDERTQYDEKKVHYM